MGTMYPWPRRDPNKPKPMTEVEVESIVRKHRWEMRQFNRSKPVSVENIMATWKKKGLKDPKEMFGKWVMKGRTFWVETVNDEADEGKEAGAPAAKP